MAMCTYAYFYLFHACNYSSRHDVIHHENANMNCARGLRRPSESEESLRPPLARAFTAGHVILYFTYVLIIQFCSTPTVYHNFLMSSTLTYLLNST